MVHDQQTFCQTQNSNFVDIFPFRRGRCSAARASEKSFLKKKNVVLGLESRSREAFVPSVEAEIFFLVETHPSIKFIMPCINPKNLWQIIHNYSTYVMNICQVII